MNKYDSYKDSDIQWIGKIPISWGTKKLKFLGTVYGGLTGKKGDDFGDEDNPKNKQYIPYTNIFNNTFISNDHFDYVVLEKDEKQNLVKKNDLFILMSSENYEDLGKTSILVDDCEELYLNTFCKGFRTTKENMNPIFINYQLQGHLHRELISVEGSGFTRINLRQGKLLNTPILITSLKEQNKIVSYLDNKVHQIDELIIKIQQKIELLREQRTSLVNEVVTKGLNPNVEMKNSGIEWIEEIPSHWDVMKLKRVGKTFGGLTGKCGDDFGQEDNPLNKSYIPYTNILRNRYISKEHFDFVTIKPEETQNKVKRLDLFFLMSSENFDDLGKTSILTDEVEELYLNSFCKGFRVHNTNTNPLFLNYQLNGNVFKKLISINGFGFTRINLRQDKLLNISILLPTPQEQEQIVLYLDKKTKIIDESISKEEERIKLLKEYKQSLISEVVTGKKRVV